MVSWNENIYLLKEMEKLFTLQKVYIHETAKKTSSQDRTVTIDDIANMPLDATISEKIDF